MGTNFRSAVRLTRIALLAAVLSAHATAHAEDPVRVKWSEDWPRVRPVEVAAAFVLPFGTFAINAYWTPARSPHWKGGILFDNWVRSALRATTYDGQATISKVGDYLYRGGVLAPLVVDFYLVGLGVHQNADVALQMLLIDLQSYGLSGLVTLSAEHGVGRARPYTDHCGPDGRTRDASGRLLFNRCVGGEDDYQSFYSGHSAAAATAAGLTCAHHQHLPLYGGGVADLAPCVLMIAAATTTGISRIVADQHWASDVLLGLSVGAFSGYVVPSLLHYGFSSGRPVGEFRVGGAYAVPTLQVSGAGAGLGLIGVLP